MTDPQPLRSGPVPVPASGAPSPALSEAADLVLMGRVAAGDREAFAALFDRHAGLVLALLARMLGREEGEEVLQEAFLQAWRQADRYDPSMASPRSWLVTIARSRALDRIRARRARTEREEAVGRELPVATPPGEAAAAAEEAEVRSRVAAALASLPAEQRRCLELAYFEGLSHREIAARLEAPLGTVKSRILLGMNRLRGALAGLAEVAP